MVVGTLLYTCPVEDTDESAQRCQRPTADNSWRRMTLDDEDTERPGGELPESGFAIEDLTRGAQAHGFGRADDGRGFAFQVKRAALRVEIYRAGLLDEVPQPEDVASVAELSVKDVDLDDERSLTALIRDAVDEAVKIERRPAQSTTIHAFLTRLGAVIDGI